MLLSFPREGEAGLSTLRHRYNYQGKYDESRNVSDSLLRVSQSRVTNGAQAILTVHS
jgi:hypothetical protein